MRNGYYAVVYTTRVIALRGSPLSPYDKPLSGGGLLRVLVGGIPKPPTSFTIWQNHEFH